MTVVQHDSNISLKSRVFNNFPHTRCCSGVWKTLDLNCCFVRFEALRLGLRHCSIRLPCQYGYGKGQKSKQSTRKQTRKTDVDEKRGLKYREKRGLNCGKVKVGSLSVCLSSCLPLFIFSLRPLKSADHAPACSPLSLSQVCLLPSSVFHPVGRCFTRLLAVLRKGWYIMCRHESPVSALID